MSDDSRRDDIARLIDPGPFWQEIPGCRWSWFEENRKEIALMKADAILALPATNPCAETMVVQTFNEAQKRYPQEAGTHRQAFTEGARWQALRTAPALAEVLDYAAWLIEMNERFGPVYFQFVHDDDWTKNHDHAVHFSRKQDAESVIEHYGWTRAKAVEHCWPALSQPQKGK